jgi:hypothetical protein
MRKQPVPGVDELCYSILVDLVTAIEPLKLLSRKFAERLAVTESFRNEITQFQLAESLQCNNYTQTEETGDVHMYFGPFSGSI